MMRSTQARYPYSSRGRARRRREATPTWMRRVADKVNQLAACECEATVSGSGILHFLSGCAPTLAWNANGRKLVFLLDENRQVSLDAATLDARPRMNPTAVVLSDDRGTFLTLKPTRGERVAEFTLQLLEAVEGRS